MKTNWVNEVLDRATRTVRAWPEWMRRPEVRGIARRADVKTLEQLEAKDAASFQVGDVYQVDESDPDSLAKVVEHPSPGTVRMEFTKDNSWGKCGKRFALHPAFVGTKVST